MVYPTWMLNQLRECLNSAYLNISGVNIIEGFDVWEVIRPWRKHQA